MEINCVPVIFGVGTKLENGVRKYKPFCLRKIDGTWVIFDPNSQDSPIFCIRQRSLFGCSSPVWGCTSPVYGQNNSQENYDSKKDTFSEWCQLFDELKFYTIEREGKQVSGYEAEWWKTKEKFGNADIDFWCEVVLS